MTKTVLVTGGAGFIGAHACKMLARSGFTPVVYDDLSTGHQEFVRWGPLVNGDIRDQRRLEAAIRAYKPEIVMHFAAKSLVGESMSNPDLYKDVNVGGTTALLNAMRRNGCNSLVMSSSAAVYGDASESPLSESAPVSPINPYGETKARAEEIAFSTAGVRTIALRYFNAAGADSEGEIWEDHDPETHLIPLVLDAAAGDRPEIRIFGRDYPTPDGTAIRDYVHVTDIAAAHVLAARALSDGMSSRALNLGSGRGTSVQEIICAARRVTGRDIPTEDVSRRAGDPAILTADAARAQEALGWRPTRSTIERILANAWSVHPGRLGRAA